MIKIKSITKERQRYVLDIEKNEKMLTLNVSEDVILAYNLFGPKTLTDKEYKHIVAFNDEQTIYDKLLYFIQYQPRSEYQVFKKGREITDNHSLLKRVIFRLKEQSFINDVHYAKIMTDSYIERNRLGPKGIAYKLSESKVADDIINHMLELYSDNLQKDNIEYHFKKQLNTSKNKSIRQFKDTLFSKLLQKGFNTSIIQNVIEQYDAEIHSKIDEMTILRSLLKKEKGPLNSYKLIQTYLRKGFKKDCIDRVIEEMK